MVIFKSFENFCGFLFFAAAIVATFALLALMIVEVCRRMTKATLEKIAFCCILLLIILVVAFAPDNSIHTYEDIERMSVQERSRSEQMILGR